MRILKGPRVAIGNIAATASRPRELDTEEADLVEPHHRARESGFFEEGMVSTGSSAGR